MHRSSASSSSSFPVTGLASLGTRNYVSKRALAAVLKQVNENPELLFRASRNSIKRSVTAAVHLISDYGPLIRHLRLPLQGSAGFHNVAYIHPVSMLSVCAERLPAYRELLTYQLGLNPSGVDNPWNIIVYNDEVSPGNQLLVLNDRQTQAIYWTFRELGAIALGCEEIWFVLAVLRSHIVERLGGMTVILSHLMMRFFDHGSDVSKGVLVRTDQGRSMLFADLGFLVADESALKHSLENKGASGILCCPLCRNCVQDMTYKKGKRPVPLDQCDDTGTLVPYTCTDITKFKKHTPKSITRYMECLRHASTTQTPTEFKELQKNIGFNFRPDGVLMNPKFGGNIINKYMSDAQHVFFVNGIFNKEMGGLLDHLKSAGYTYQMIQDHIDKVHFPSRCPSNKALKKLFTKAKKSGDDFKCSASEGLSLLGVMQHFVKWVIRDGDANAAVKAACVSFISLCDALEHVFHATAGKCDQEQFQHDLAAFMCNHQSVYDCKKWVSKFHAALHLPEMFDRFKILVTCWVLERKHKEVKRLANNYMTSRDSWELGLCEELLRKQFDELNAPGRFSPGVTLVVAKQGSDLLQQMVAEMGLSGPVMAGFEATTHGLSVKRGDVVKWQHGHTTVFGDVFFHFASGNSYYTCVRPWIHLKGRKYNRDGEACIIETFSIVNTCVFFDNGYPIATVL